MYGDHMCLPRSTASATGDDSTFGYGNEGSEVRNGNEDGDGGEDGNWGEEYHEPSEYQMRSISARWILGIRERCKLPQSTMDEIVQSVTDLHQHYMSLIYSSVKRVILEAGIDIDSIPKLKSTFDPNGSFGRPFKGVENSYQLLKYCKENLGFVVRTYRV